jgi:cyclic-di-GMP phosphodiesterase TipF (flagellum assembly factor)
MLRLMAIFIAVCVVIIAASLGAVAYLLLGLSIAESAIVALAVLTALTLYNMVSGRVRDRSDVGDQIADLSRGTADLARQVAEFGRKLAAVELEVKSAGHRAKAATDPLSAEIGELGLLIKQLAETVAAHDAALVRMGVVATAAPGVPLMPPPAPVASPEEAPSPGMSGDVTPPPASPVTGGSFKGRPAGEIVAAVQAAVDHNRVDLYLQPIVTLPQRKVRYYEGMTRLRDEDGNLMLPADFLAAAEQAGLMPKVDNLLIFRCVQVVRRLLVKNREVGLFCNISARTLQDSEAFRHFLQFMDANRAIASSLMLEFTQNAFSRFGPIENESLAALAERGFRFSIDQVTELQLEPRRLAERGVRFVKVPASLLLNRALASSGDIHTADLSDLLGRHGITLIADKIETEAMVVDLLDFDVRFGQGFLFSPPRPVRPEALQGLGDRIEAAAGLREASAAPARIEGMRALAAEAPALRTAAEVGRP